PASCVAQPKSGHDLRRYRLENDSAAGYQCLYVPSAHGINLLAVARIFPRPQLQLAGPNFTMSYEAIALLKCALGQPPDRIELLFHVEQSAIEKFAAVTGAASEQFE